jgi:hypothetical protein
MERQKYEGCCSKKPFALVIIESAVSVEIFLAAGLKVGILSEDQQDLNYKILYFVDRASRYNYCY